MAKVIRLPSAAKDDPIYREGFSLTSVCRRHTQGDERAQPETCPHDAASAECPRGGDIGSTAEGWRHRIPDHGS